MQKLKLFVFVGLILSVSVFASAGIFDFLIKDNRDSTFEREVSIALKDQGLDEVNRSHEIDWPRETAKTCLAHPTDPNFNLPCLEVQTYFENCTAYEINFYNETKVIFLEDESSETIITLLNETTGNCISFEKINKTIEEIQIEFEELEDKKLEQLGRAFHERSKTSNPEIISEGIITIK